MDKNVLLHKWAFAYTQPTLFHVPWKVNKDCVITMYKEVTRYDPIYEKITMINTNSIFAFFDIKTNQMIEWCTGSKGAILQRGKYKVQEVMSANGTTLNKEPFFITVTKSQNICISEEEAQGVIMEVSMVNNNIDTSSILIDEEFCCVGYMGSGVNRRRYNVYNKTDVSDILNESNKRLIKYDIYRLSDKRYIKSILQTGYSSGHNYILSNSNALEGRAYLTTANWANDKASDYSVYTTTRPITINAPRYTMSYGSIDVWKDNNNYTVNFSKQAGSSIDIITRKRQYIKIDYESSNYVPESSREEYEDFMKGFNMKNFSLSNFNFKEDWGNEDDFSEISVNGYEGYYYYNSDVLYNYNMSMPLFKEISSQQEIIYGETEISNIYFIENIASPPDAIQEVYYKVRYPKCYNTIVTNEEDLKLLSLLENQSDNSYSWNFFTYQNSQVKDFTMKYAVIPAQKSDIYNDWLEFYNNNLNIKDGD